MPGITIKGVRGLSAALSEFSRTLSTQLADRTLATIVQETRGRLEQDTPVITGRLLRSTVARRTMPGHHVLGQFAPYSNVVNNRRGYWTGAIGVAQKWPPFYAKTVAAEWGIMSRKHAGT